MGRNSIDGDAASDAAADLYQLLISFALSMPDVDRVVAHIDTLTEAVARARMAPGAVPCIIEDEV